ncbi:MAG: ABC transporter permease [Thauera sp.]|nr:ABC transporter permease [Thauera sp.]
MSLPTTLSTAWRNIVRQLTRSRAALAAIAFGVVAMMLAAGFIDWNLRFGRDNTIQSQLGHLQVMKPGFLDHGRADPYAYLLPPPSAADEAALAALPGFRVAAPRLLINGLASSGETTLSFIGEGVDAAAEQQLSAALRFSAGRNLLPGEPQTAIVGEGLARNLGLVPGAQLVLIANTENGGISAVEAEVVGLFQSISQAYDDSALRIPIELARQLMRSEGEHLRLVLLEDTADTARAHQQLNQALDSSRYQVVPWQELADFYNKTSALFKKQVGVIRTIIALIIVLAISNTMSMAVMERMSEIGTMMALGTRQRGILTMFVLEGVILGVLGAALGVVLGTGLALLLSAIGIPMPASPGMAWGYEAGVLISIDNIVVAAGIALLTTLLASLYPAWRASREPIVDALRTRQ